MVTGSDVSLQGFGKREGTLMVTGIDLQRVDIKLTNEKSENYLKFY